MTMEEGHQVALASIASGVTSRLYVFLAVAVLGCSLFLKVSTNALIKKATIIFL